mmetsp:Transcript_38086/g.70243  ORF Transcript_38086/g.70243 Transcript_38086/m.70243 type:complete len:504 (-) Transcript_38086:153-1664(-)
MTLPKRNKPWRNRGGMTDSYLSLSSESSSQHQSASRRSSDFEGKSQSDVVGGVLKKFSRRSQLGKGFDDFLESAYASGDVSAGNAVSRDEAEHRPRGAPSDEGRSSDEGSDNLSASEDDESAPQCERPNLTKNTGPSASSATGSLAHEGALATLMAMFAPPWTEERLNKVLVLNDKNLTKSVESILSHGNNPPEDLVRRLLMSKTALQGSRDSVRNFPKDLIHHPDDDVSAITMESSMDFSRKEKSPSESVRSHLPVIEDDDEYSIEGHLERRRKEVQDDLASGVHTDQPSVIKHSLSSDTKDTVSEDSVDAAGIDQAEVSLERVDSDAVDFAGKSPFSQGTLWEGSPSLADEDVGDGDNYDQEDSNTITKLEAKVMKLAGTLASGEQTASVTKSNSEDSSRSPPMQAVLLPDETMRSRDGYGTSMTIRTNQSKHSNSELDSLRRENKVLKSHVAELTEKLEYLQEAMERMLTNQESIVGSVLKQRQEMEMVLSGMSARHHEI